MRPALIAIATFLIVVLAVALFFAIRITKGPPPKPVTQAATPALTLVSTHDRYDAGTHTVSGSLLLPTACTAYDATSTVEGGAIRIDIDSKADTKVCLQRLATSTFSVEAEGGADSPVRIYINGTLATTTS